MSRFERIIIELSFLAILWFSYSTNERLKVLEAENKGWNCVIDSISNSAYKTEAKVRGMERDWPSVEIQQLQQAVVYLQQRVSELEGK